MTNADVLVRVENIKKYFPISKGAFGRVTGYVRAVDGVTFDIRKGESFGLVGESGCGKTTTGRAILRLVELTAGRVFFDGQDLAQVDDVEMRKLRRRMQIVFQDPYSSLNPRMNVGAALVEPLTAHGIGAPAERLEKAKALLAQVGLRPFHLNRYPHEFSGGQRQRIVIARALSVDPEFIVCDEPVSALDVSIQSQILNLLKELQAKFGLTYLFVAHNLAVVRYISDRVGVMYLGKMVELADEREIYNHPVHPYTKALLAAVPGGDSGFERDKHILAGDVPSPANPPPGCSFHTRCPVARPDCKEVVPEWREIGPRHYVACHLAG